MKYFATDLGATITGIDGKPLLIVNEAGTDTEAITVKEAFRRALANVFHDEVPSQANPNNGLSFEKKMDRYNTSKKIFNCETSCDLKTEEQAELKSCVNKFFRSPEFIGFLEPILENKTGKAVIK